MWWFVVFSAELPGHFVVRVTLLTISTQKMVCGFFQAELSLRGHDQHRGKTLGTIFRLSQVMKNKVSEMIISIHDCML